jgi:hypothetical protein
VVVRCEHHWLATPVLPVCIHCGRTPHASPSQLETWIGCQRKHAYNRSRPRQPSGPAAQYGDVCHTVLEDWERDGTPPDANTDHGRTCLPALPLLPLPRTPGMLVEHTAKPTMLGVDWFMRMDLLYGYVPKQSIVVHDHKTTGDIAENAKTPEELSTTDPQGISYLYWATETFDVPLGIGCWLYLERGKKPAKPRPVIFTITRDEARRRFAIMHVTYVLPMVRSRPYPPETFPRNLDYCDAFGRCAHMTECHSTLTDQERNQHALVQLRKAT